MCGSPKFFSRPSILGARARKQAMDLLERSSLGGCPSDDELFQLVRGELGPEQLDAILAHTGVCEGCALVVAESGLAIAVEEGDVVERARSSLPGLFAPGQLIAS